jgi:hypothetical protein
MRLLEKQNIIQNKLDNLITQLKFKQHTLSPLEVLNLYFEIDLMRSTIGEINTKLSMGFKNPDLVKSKLLDIDIYLHYQ